MNRTPDTESSNPIARGLRKFFSRGRVGQDAMPERGPSTVQRPASTGTRPTAASEGSAPLVGAAAQSARPVRPTPVPASAGPAAAAVSVGQPATSTTTARRTHTVAPGDTLSKIAQQVYGRADRWPLIFDANRATISDPDRIYPGQVLVLPEPPAMH